MSVTRAASNGSLSNGVGPRSSTKKTAAPKKPPAGEIIVISDTEEEEEEDNELAAHHDKLTRKRKISQPQPPSDSSKRFRNSKVVEPREDPPAVKEWKNRSRAAEQSAEASANADLEVLRKELKESRDKEKQLAAKANTAEEALATAMTTLDVLGQNVLCVICLEMMWLPWMLSECGHTFCQGCLTRWFNMTHDQHVHNWHPRDVNSTALITPAELALLPLQQQRRPFAHLVPIPRPLFFCPLCPFQVTRKPSEAPVVKTIVELIAARTGEREPDSSTVVPSDGPWDKFFGRS